MPYGSSSAAGDVGVARTGSRITRAMQSSAARGETSGPRPERRSAFAGIELPPASPSPGKGMPHGAAGGIVRDPQLPWKRHCSSTPEELSPWLSGLEDLWLACAVERDQVVKGDACGRRRDPWRAHPSALATTVRVEGSARIVVRSRELVAQRVSVPVTVTLVTVVVEL
ncbi:MAG: hypothetical protein JO363_15455 [Solirubrobacterales bacterium]|nr:hypothetical protein [Solirubrobacterales bacterium]